MPTPSAGRELSKRKHCHSSSCLKNTPYGTRSWSTQSIIIQSVHTRVWEISSLCLPAVRNMMNLCAVGNGLAGSCNTTTAKPHEYFDYTGNREIMETRDDRKAGNIFRKGCHALRDDRRAYSGGVTGKLCVERPDSTGTTSRPARTHDHCGQYPVCGNGLGIRRASERLF